MDINIEIQLKEWGNLDLTDDISIPLIFNIDDIKNFGSRKSSFSKTIKIIGNDNNNKILSSVFEIKNDGSFDMRITHDCVLLVNKNVIMNGYMKLNSIEKIHIGSNQFAIYYNVNIYDEIKNLFNDLGEKKLKDIDFSRGISFQGQGYGVGDHIYSADHIKATIESGETFTNVYDYPIVNHGYNLTEPFPINSVALAQMYPAVYHRAIMDRIFEDAGWNYQSNYFDGTNYDGIFNKIVNIYNGENTFTNMNLCQYWEDARVYSSNAYSKCGKNSASFSGSTIYHYELDDYLYTGSTYSGPVVIEDGLYTIKVYLDIDEDEGGGWGDAACQGSGNGLESQYKLTKITEGGDIEILKIWSTFDFTGGYLSGTSFTTIESVSGITLDENDRILLYVDNGSIAYLEPDCAPLGIDVTTDSIGIELIKENEKEGFVDLEGTTIDLASFLPDMTQADFLRNHIKLANLYLWQEKTSTNEKLLYAEPRDDFYDNDLGAGILNWTDKIDWNKKIKIEDLNKDLKRELEFTYTLGTDYYSTSYDDIYGYIYGNKIYDANNSLLSGVDTTKVDWQSIQFYRNFVNIPVRTKDFDKFLDEISAAKPLLGLMDTTSVIISGEAWSIAGAENNTELDFVKSAAHAMNWAGRQYDYNFETVNPIISGSGLFGDLNSYNLYWENYVDNITNSAARRVTYYMHLTYSDIINLNFRDTIQIDGQEYILEKVEYDPTKNTSSKVTLLKKKVIE